MPTVEKTSGGLVHYRSLGRQLVSGDQIDVSDGMANHLCDVRGEFERIVETCQVEKSNGEICGRELPCGYHSDDEESDE